MAIVPALWYCVSLIRRRYPMNDYMKALYQRFFQKPDVTELEDEIETARQEVRD